jgi:hypothetical protein
MPTHNAPAGYTPVDPPTTTEAMVVANWAIRELKNIASVLQEHQYGKDQVLYVAPKKVYDGLIVLADGTKWNPGNGKGFYGYHTGAWHFLG